MLLFLVFAAIQLTAQNDLGVKGVSLSNTDTKAEETKPIHKLNSFFNKFSFTASAGTVSLAPNDLKNLSLRQVTLGDLNISYKVNPRFSFGLSSIGSLGNCTSGYYNAEGKLIPFQRYEIELEDLFEKEDDHDDDTEHESEDDDLDDDDNDDDEHDDEDDDDCEEAGVNIIGTATFILSEKVPFFVQAGAGYSFTDKAIAYTAFWGYSQKIFAGFGIQAGIRYSDVLRQKPVDAISVNPSSGLKAELGLNWNF